MIEKIKAAVEKEITELKKYQLEQVHMANNPAVYGEVSPNGHENAEDEIFFLHKILDYVKTCDENFNILIENRDEIEKEISKERKVVN